MVIPLLVVVLRSMTFLLQELSFQIGGTTLGDDVTDLCPLRDVPVVERGYLRVGQRRHQLLTGRVQIGDPGLEGHFRKFKPPSDQ